MPARSAKTGRFVSKATAGRHPRTTIVQSSSSKASGYRSAVTGQFVTEAAARRSPNTTIHEGGH